MTKSILLKPFHVDDETEEVMAIAYLWDKEVEIFLDDDDLNDKRPNDNQLKQIITHLAWLNSNKKSVIDFALDSQDFIYNFNDWVKDEIDKKGKAVLYDDSILTKPVSYDEIYRSILISSVFIFDDMFMSVDLVTKPDYFGGHAFTVEIDDNFSMDFGGVNG